MNGDNCVPSIRRQQRLSYFSGQAIQKMYTWSTTIFNTGQAQAIFFFLTSQFEV
jgi:hypothetical protein